MARHVREFFRELPQDTHDALAKTWHLGSSATLRYLERKKVSVVTPISEVRAITKKKSERHDVPIVVSSGKIDELVDKGICDKNCDGLAVEFANGDTKVYIHPCVQYRSRNYIKDLVEHEVDHVKVFRKRKGVQKPMASGIMRI